VVSYSPVSLRIPVCICLKLFTTLFSWVQCLYTLRPKYNWILQMHYVAEMKENWRCIFYELSQTVSNSVSEWWGSVRFSIFLMESSSIIPRTLKIVLVQYLFHSVLTVYVFKLEHNVVIHRFFATVHLTSHAVHSIIIQVSKVAQCASHRRDRKQRRRSEWQADVVQHTSYVNPRVTLCRIIRSANQFFAFIRE